MSELNSNFVALENFSSAIEAHIMQGALEAEGIESVIIGETINTVQPYIATGVKLMVHEDNLEKALEIIKSNELGKVEDEEEES